MCGILGSVNLDFDERHLNTMSHRGPDDHGLESFSVDHRQIVLGQRRLSILDLSPAGHQPMISKNEEYYIVFNGEVYNHLELREKLVGFHEFAGHSDTETIFYYLIKFGIAGARDFNGIFSIAFVDRRNRLVYLIRDPFGIKPLYYHISKTELVFSSEIRPLRALLNEPALHPEALASVLRLRFSPSPDTIFRGIKKVRPGHYVKVGLAEAALTHECCSFLTPLPSQSVIHREDAVAQYGRHLNDAVKRQLLSDVEIGILLSGGIDSALIAAVARKNYSGTIKAFTIGFEGNFEEDEIEDAAETAKYLGLEHHCEKIRFDDFIDTLRVCAQIVEEPSATTSIVPMHFLSQLASRYVKVVLTGQGADETLGGYTKYKSELVRPMIPSFLHAYFQPIVRSTLPKNENLSRAASAIANKTEAERFLAVYEIFSTKEIAELINRTETSSIRYVSYLYKVLGLEKHGSSVERMMAIDARLNLADDLLNYTDKITMHSSIECRVPLLDLELVSFIESLPRRHKLNMSGGKIIHKLYAKKVLPEHIINRKKKGFKSPTSFWFRENSGMIRDILLAEGTPFARIFNQAKVGAIIDQHKQGYNKEKQIFLLLSIYFILETF